MGAKELHGRTGDSAMRNFLLFWVREKTAFPGSLGLKFDLSSSSIAQGWLCSLSLPAKPDDLHCKESGEGLTCWGLTRVLLPG